MSRYYDPNPPRFKFPEDLEMIWLLGFPILMALVAIGGVAWMIVDKLSQ